MFFFATGKNTDHRSIPYHTRQLLWGKSSLRWTHLRLPSYIFYQGHQHQLCTLTSSAVMYTVDWLAFPLPKGPV